MIQRLSYLEINKNYINQYQGKNIMSIPLFYSVIISSCLNVTRFNHNDVANIFEILWLISNQKPKYIQSKISVSNFKLRKDSIIGSCVTLRRVKMFNFLEKLCRIYLPRIKDFNGIMISKKCINTVSIGINDISVFIEIPSNLIINGYGLTISINIKKRNNRHNVQVQDIYSTMKFFNFPVKII